MSSLVEGNGKVNQKAAEQNPSPFRAGRSEKFRVKLRDYTRGNKSRFVELRDLQSRSTPGK